MPVITPLITASEASALKLVIKPLVHHYFLMPQYSVWCSVSISLLPK